MKIHITVNGVPSDADVEPRLLLVHHLRDTLGLTATNIGCDTTSCGACTVLLDGESVKSCTVLAVQADGTEVTTLEGLSPSLDELHPVAAAFRQEHGLQCGFCTPGMVMAAVGLLREQARRGEHHAARAVAALERVMLVEALLQRVERAALREPFDRRDRMPVGLDSEHGARTARRRVAADDGACQVEPFAQDVDEQLPRVELELERDVVHRERDVPHSRASFRTWRRAGPPSPRAYDFGARLAAQLELAV